MDPRERADAALARARARGAFVVTPEDAISPMDASATIQIPRVLVAALDERQQPDPEATMVVQHPLAQSQPTQSQPSPRPPFPHQQGYQQHQPQRQQQQPEQEQQQPAEGMVPTAKQRRTMSERLDGTL